MANPASVIAHRLYADFLMPSRLPTYRQLLQSFLDAGYAVISIETFWSQVTAGTRDPARPVVILRHDIDTDPGTGRRMWEIERDLAVSGSFFFRLSTLDLPLMAEIADSGGHASYHYEELATIAKRRRIRTRQDVDRHLGEAQDEFRGNIARLRVATNLPLSIVASHGDFVNRALGVPNWHILTDERFRRETGILLETYDDAVMSHVTSRHADTLHPTYWRPDHPSEAIRRGEKVVYLLVHPRHWHVARAVNARDDIGRVWENLVYSGPLRRAPR